MLPPHTTRAAFRTIGIASIVVLLLLALTTLGELLRESKPKDVSPLQPPLPALTERLVLIIVDGLRYDYATDPERAPRFARHMRESANAEVWAGRVTMTSAAVLAMGTGQRGSFAHIVLNLNASRAKHNDLLSNARAAGLKTALAGDIVWVQAFGDFDAQILDEEGLALEVDNSPEILEAGEKLALEEPFPNLLIVHIVAPDHQAHAYRADSPRYAEHLKRLDEGLGALLDKLPSDATVIALSDHGVLDNGQHGVDSILERRTPLFAYGPGIQREAISTSFEQVDIAPTLAALLGIPSPTHGRGVPITDLLDISEDDAALISCANADRVLKTAEAEGYTSFVESMKEEHPGCSLPGADAETKRLSGHAIGRAWDAYLERAEASTSKKAMGIALALLAAFLTLSLGTLSPGREKSWRPMASLGRVGIAMAVAASSVLLTWIVDHTTPPYNEVRAVVVLLAQLPFYLALLWPSLGERLYARAPFLAFALMPAVVAWSFPMNARLHAFISIAIGSTLWLLFPHRVADASPPPKTSRAISAVQIVPAALAVACLGIYALGPEDDPIASFADKPTWLFALGVLALASWLITFAKRRDTEFSWTDLGLALAIAALGIFGRHHLPAALGLTLLVTLPVLAYPLARRGRMTLALGFALGAYGLVSRDGEILAVAAAGFVAEAIGTSAASALPRREPILRRPFALATLLVLLFGLVFLARVGVQRGLDFTTIDWGAGVFGDSSPSQLRIALAIVAKYVIAELVVIGAFVHKLSLPLTQGVILGSTLLWVGRAVTLALILFSSDGGAYWTALRAMSDLPTAVLIALTLAILLVGVSGDAEAKDAGALEEPKADDELLAA